MNPSYSLLYSYIVAVLASLCLIVLTRHGARDSGRRIFPDETLGRIAHESSASTNPEARKPPHGHCLGNAIVVNTDFALPPQGELTSDLVVEGTLTLGDGARLHGNARASGIISLGSRALVVGNLVSESDIYVGPNAEVVGVLHAKENVWLMPSSSVSISVVSARMIYIHEGARVGRQVFASRGIVYQSSQKIAQPAVQPAASHAPIPVQLSQPVCCRCHSLLLTLDPFRQQWRCLNCGSYQWPTASFSPYAFEVRTMGGTESEA